MRRIILAVVLLLPALPLHAQENSAAIAMYGEPKYAADFAHFDYVNPDAPKGGMLKLGAVGSFDTLNPFIVRGDPALGLNTGYLSLVYEPLLARSADEPFTLYGLLAESIEVPPDRSSITFDLNPKAHFSDGQPVTADDVMFSFITLRDQGRPNHRIYYKKVERAEKLNERSVKFSFLRNADGSVDREMPLIMGLMPVLPKHDWEGRNFNQTTLRVPVGSGPYKIVAVDAGRSITYMRDADYWGRDVPAMRGQYNFERIRIDYYRDDNIVLQAFKAGQFDLRREPDPVKWTTSYDFTAARDGRVKLEQIPHHRTEPAYGFVLNTRRAPFSDPALRAALEYTFDFGWVNHNLFHDLYHPVESYFPNSELAAPALPEGEELKVLDKYRAQLPPDIFTTPITPPVTDGTEESLRKNLLQASAMLRVAGYTLKEGKLYAPRASQPISFEILLSDPVEEKIALSWARSLKRIGIEARVHTVDSAQFQARLASFSYDVTTARWFNSLSPGNEQAFFWGSAAADQQGSRNYPGIKSPVIDALAAAIPASHTRPELIAATRALDRVLMAGHYIVPLYYLGVDDYAFRAELHHPDTIPLTGTVLESWWMQ